MRALASNGHDFFCVELTSKRQVDDLESRIGQPMGMTLRPSRDRGMLAILFPNISLSRSFTGAPGDYSLIEIHTLSAEEITSHIMPNKLEIVDTLKQNFPLLTVFSILTLRITSIAEVSYI